ncbi:competence protein ComEC [Rodentibacter caecimuris]|uniref:Competence protein ComEC n=1 Tax=Rodentibacter caecimuris TaxID=1796644 RepID=A0A1V3KPE3_9PAST|nr:MBL fold metallo-hydrolase [Rodentibacter heylii]OOF79043.1 competence protein ComEC [Rodentibacter heylii]
MNDFFEIDFLDVEAAQSGDAITIRYCKNGGKSIHVVDGGFKGREDGEGTGDKVIHHIKKYYGTNKINRVVVTHPDRDHAGGLRKVLENCEVDELWMLKPWDYTDELIERFARLRSEERLADRLKECYPNIAALEEIANSRGIPIKTPFQGAKIGDFTVLAPTKDRYLDLIEQSEKTPEVKSEQVSLPRLSAALESVKNFVRAAWGDENLSNEPTSAENNMSIVQYAELNGKKIMLTGDAGCEALEEAKKYLVDHLHVSLPGIDYFQVPHHGSRRNISSELLDNICGQKLSFLERKKQNFTAVISSAKEDKDHPRKAVLRALMHRGGKVITTEGKTICCSISAPSRSGWIPVTPESYPEDQED